MAAAKVTFKPSDERRAAGDVTTKKEWDIKLNGVVVGQIESYIRDLNQDYVTPGYSVTVIATIEGVEKPYRENSGTFSNRSMLEARTNRSTYVARSKEWAKEVLAKLNAAASVAES